MTLSTALTSGFIVWATVATLAIVLTWIYRRNQLSKGMFEFLISGTNAEFKVRADNLWDAYIKARKYAPGRLRLYLIHTIWSNVKAMKDPEFVHIEAHHGWDHEKKVRPVLVIHRTDVPIDQVENPKWHFSEGGGI